MWPGILKMLGGFYLCRGTSVRADRCALLFQAFSGWVLLKIWWVLTSTPVCVHGPPFCLYFMQCILKSVCGSMTCRKEFPVSPCDTAFLLIILTVGQFLALEGENDWAQMFYLGLLTFSFKSIWAQHVHTPQCSVFPWILHTVVLSLSVFEMQGEGPGMELTQQHSARLESAVMSSILDTKRKKRKKKETQVDLQFSNNLQTSVTGCF